MINFFELTKTLQDKVNRDETITLDMAGNLIRDGEYLECHDEIYEE